MENLKPQQNTQNLESDKSADLFMQEVINKFRKLPKLKRGSICAEKMDELEEINNSIRLAVEEATKTGSIEKIEEAKKLQAEFNEKAGELKQLIEATELFVGEFVMEIIPDKEITSAETAIQKLEKEGYEITSYAEDMLAKIDWEEKLKDSYEIISITAAELFGDTESHTYAEMKAKAIEKGLELVPAKLVPSIRLNYDKKGFGISIGTKAIAERYGNLKLFFCYMDRSVPWLYTTSGGDDSGCFGTFFFVRK